MAVLTRVGGACRVAIFTRVGASTRMRAGSAGRVLALLVRGGVAWRSRTGELQRGERLPRRACRVPPPPRGGISERAVGRMVGGGDGGARSPCA